MTPALFEMAVTGNADGIYCVLEDGDFVNPQVIFCTHALRSGFSHLVSIIF